MTANLAMSVILILTVGLNPVLAQRPDAIPTPQDLRLEIVVPKTKIKARDPVDLTINLSNVSAKSFYVCGKIDLQVGGFGYSLGRYVLEVREFGTTNFRRPGELVGDRFSQGVVPSVSDVIVDNGLVLLQEGMFIGRVSHSTWKGLTTLDPGRYSIRVIYETYGPDRSFVPKEIRYPVFLHSVVSNLIDIEIQP